MKILIKQLPNIYNYVQYILPFQLSSDVTITMILKQLCSQYKVAKFVDDDYRNIEAAKALKIPNLQVITAHK